MQTPVLVPPVVRGSAARMSWRARRNELRGVLPSCACPAQGGAEEAEESEEYGGEEHGEGAEGGESAVEGS